MSKLLSWKTVKTKKDYKCWGCCKKYSAGTEMIRASYTDSGTAYTIYWCKICEEYMRKYSKYEDGYGQGEIYENDKETWEAIKMELKGLNIE